MIFSFNNRNKTIVNLEGFREIYIHVNQDTISIYYDNIEHIEVYYGDKESLYKDYEYLLTKLEVI